MGRSGGVPGERVTVVGLRVPRLRELGSVLALLVMGSGVSVWPAEPVHVAERLDREKGQAHIELDIALPEYRLTNEGDWTVLDCQDPEAKPFLKQGEPALCSYTYYVAVPAGATVQHISATPRPRHVPLAKPIRPVSEDVLVGHPPKPPIPDGAIYRSPASYPEHNVTYSIGKRANTTLLTLTVYPFKYLGRSQTLLVHEWTSISVVLNVPDKPAVSKPRTAVDENLRKRLVNPTSALMGQGDHP